MTRSVYAKLHTPHLSRIAVIEFDPLVPLVDVVWVLPQKHAVQQERPAHDQLLEPSQAQLQINVIYNREVTTNICHNICMAHHTMSCFL